MATEQDGGCRFTVANDDESQRLWSEGRREWAFLLPIPSAKLEIISGLKTYKMSSNDSKEVDKKLLKKYDVQKHFAGAKYLVGGALAGKGRNSVHAKKQKNS